jgi:hypothetical protein
MQYTRTRAGLPSARALPQGRSQALARLDPCRALHCSGTRRRAARRPRAAPPCRQRRAAPMGRWSEGAAAPGVGGRRETAAPAARGLTRPRVGMPSAAAACRREGDRRRSPGSLGEREGGREATSGRRISCGGVPRRKTRTPPRILPRPAHRRSRRLCAERGRGARNGRLAARQRARARLYAALAARRRRRRAGGARRAAAGPRARGAPRAAPGARPAVAARWGAAAAARPRRRRRRSDTRARRRRARRRARPRPRVAPGTSCGWRRLAAVGDNAARRGAVRARRGGRRRERPSWRAPGGRSPQRPAPLDAPRSARSSWRCARVSASGRGARAARARSPAAQ